MEQGEDFRLPVLYVRKILGEFSEKNGINCPMSFWPGGSFKKRNF